MARSTKPRGSRSKPNQNAAETPENPTDATSPAPATDQPPPPDQSENTSGQPGDSPETVADTLPAATEPAADAPVPERPASDVAGEPDAEPLIAAAPDGETGAGTGERPNEPIAHPDQPTSEAGAGNPPDLTGDARTDDPVETAAAPDTSQHDPHPSPVLAPVPTEQPRIASGPGFFTLLLGGVVAGGIGYAIAEYDLFRFGGEDPVARLEARLEDQSGRIDVLGAQTSAAEEAAANATAAATTASEAAAALPQDLAALRAEIANLPVGSADTADPALATRLSEAESRLDELAAAMGATPGEDVVTSDELAAVEQELAALRETVDAQQAAIDDAIAAADAARSSAADETRRITAQGALAQIAAALENGEPFVDATSDLTTAGNVDVPPALMTVADQGVSPLAALQEDFAPAARAALAVSIRAESGGSAWDRFTAFLRAQTGARSLDAREGDDPDAILSRAQTAVRTGDLATALDEIATLPEAGQAEMADWSARARARLDALLALDDLTGSLNSN